MDRFIYIHGFNSGRNSRSGRELSTLLGVPVICPEYDYSRPFAECIAALRRQMDEAVDGENDRLTVMGSSLGGFYALQLRHPATVHVAAWNPVVFPALQLEQFLGRNTRFSDRSEWEFTRETLLSYAQAPDPRPWCNGMWIWEQRCLKKNEDRDIFSGIDSRVGIGMIEGETGALYSGRAGEKVLRRPRRDIFLADRDEILDSGLCRAFWQNVAELHDIVSGHQILDYSHAGQILRNGKMPVSFRE